MALLTRMTFDEARDLSGQFGLDLARVEPLVLGSVNSNFRFTVASGAAYFARIYEEQGFDGARTELQALSTLAAEGVPVVRPLRTRDGALLVDFQGKPSAIFPWVHGDWLCLQRVNVEHCKKLGAALAQVHLSTSKVGPLPLGRFRPEDMLERLDRAEPELPRLSPEIARIRSGYARYLERRTSLPHGVCHGDLFRDNVLWNGQGEICALLDFESVSQGPFVYDLMVTALAWCFTDTLLLSHVRALFEGYAGARRPSAEERRALEVEGALACLRFATTRITDFELRTPPGELPARSFRRFLERLEVLESGVLESVRECLA